ncbi:MAG: chromosome segregation protein SMC [Pseudomonadota bacterium]
MRFTRLRLNGFKSFVDPTDLLIQDGLTGVVGPNGCGKSNLLEALRWVMGENRPTAMRGDGMEDVIFSGTATRSARNFAEVALHIDNRDRLAPASFNNADLLEITRRVTRDAGSAFKVNTKDSRARDVQMLFADASTGAHSPALVRQGQVAELINAKPKSRRRILEEAAGISGLYQRRHEAELKLKATEQNLLRVDDVVEQLAARLSQLARQAKQAARYREIGVALRQAEGMLLYRRWRDADDARATALAALQTCLTEAGAAERAAARASFARTEAEERLPPLREEEAIASAVLQRLLVQRDTLVGEAQRAQEAVERLTARIAQLAQDHSRETALNRDAGDSIRQLEQEAADLRAKAEGDPALLAEAAEAARDASQILEDRESALSHLTEEAARLRARHQSAERVLIDTQKTLSRNEEEASKARAGEHSAVETLERSKTAFSEAQAALDGARDAAKEAELALVDAEKERADTQSREADARAARSAAEGELHALKAEAAALAKLVARDTADGGLIDAVKVTPGYEKALGAALADDLRAPEIDMAGKSGWAPMPDYQQTQALPDSAEPLDGYVSVPGVLARRIQQIGVVDAALGPALQGALLPGQRLVSLAGDLWRWDGFRAGAEDAPTAAALRLQQVNRLEDVKQSLARVQALADGAQQAHTVLKNALDECTQADRAAREARREADDRVTQATRALSQIEADRNIATGRLETSRLALERHEEEARKAGLALAEAQATQRGLADQAAVQAQVNDVKVAVEAARMTMMAKRAAHDEALRAGRAREARLRNVEKDLASWRARLENAEARLAELSAREADAQAELDAAQSTPVTLAEDRARLDVEIEAATVRRAASAEALANAEALSREAGTVEREAERAAGEAREARAAAQARADAAGEAVMAAQARIDEAQGLSPEALLERLDCLLEAIGDAEALEAEAGRLKRQRDALGAVNLRAEEDARVVEEEHDALLTEKADLEAAIAKLRAGVASLNREGRERLLTAFEQVHSNFSMLFTHLFGGGEANLVLVESDDPLEAGLEIMCQPPGKKLSTLSLLSGGEQTLTALALIFAVFLANPAPICVLDEVDAPLDDANVTRFCDMLDEMTRRADTRFLIITHHAVTMARMDRLFGVTMGEQGVSQLVSVDLSGAEAMVA